ncbi:MAG: ABC transporter permease [Flavobacteriaceae bacterium]|nr:ABC transporter permease [Flavobacteriaceae bacterium]
MKALFYIAQKYLFSKSTQRSVNLINYITFTVIIIGSAALFIVLSAFSGLRTYSLSYTNNYDPDFQISPSSGKFLKVSDDELQKIRGLDEVTYLAAEVREKVYLQFKNNSTIATIVGVSENYSEVSPIDEALFFGNWNLENNLSSIGIGLSNKLELPILNFENPLQLLVPKKGNLTFASQGIGSQPFNRAHVVVSSVFSLDEESDNSLLYTDMALVQNLLELHPEEYTSLIVRANNPADFKTIYAELRELLSEEIEIKSKEEFNAALYKMLNTEFAATYTVFTLILIIALFNLTGALITIIIDKKEQLRSIAQMGLTISHLKSIFFVQGLFISVLGGGVGLLFGSLIISSQIQFEWLKIAPNLPYPVNITAVNYLIVLVTISVLGSISSLVAAQKVSPRLLS